MGDTNRYAICRGDDQMEKGFGGDDTFVGFVLMLYANLF